MARYLWKASYTPQGARGLLAEGGTSRRQMLEKLVQNLGGRLEAFYFAFGDDDVVAIGEVPDQVTAASIALTIGAAGAVRISTTVLLTPEEIDRATEATVEYRAPGE